MDKFLVEVIDLQLGGTDWKWRRIGQIDEYLNLDIILRYNDVSTFTLRVMAGTPQAALLKPGRGIVVWYEGLDTPLLSGPLRGLQRWSDDTNTGPGSIDWSGYDFNILLKEALCFPDPKTGIGTDLKAGPRAAGKVTNGYDEAKTNFSIERFFYALCSYSIGAENLAGRTRRGVSFPNSSTLPPSTTAPFTTYQLRFDYMLDAFKAQAETAVNADGTTADPYGFQLEWNPVTEKVELDLFRPRQRGELVRFSKGLGNLQRFSYTLNASKGNRIIVGLDNTMVAGDLPVTTDTDPSDNPETRNFIVGGNGLNPYVWNNTAYGTPDDEWGNLSEVFSDRRDLATFKEGATVTGMNTPVNQANLNVDALQQAVAQDILDNAATAAISIEPIDTVGCRFGRDYFLGDKVTYTEDEEEITDVLREVHLTNASGSGLTIVPTIGTGDASETPALYQEVRRIWQRLTKIGTNK